MPEITSRDHIQEKLQDFDMRLDGAFYAMKTMMRLKKEAEQLVDTIWKTIDDTAKISQHLQHIQEEWNTLKDGVAKTQKDAESSFQKLLQQFDQTCVDLVHRFNEEVDRLYQANEASRSEHIQFAEESRIHAERTARDSETVANLIMQAEQLLKITKQNLFREIEDRLTEIELLTGERLGKIENEWQKKVVSLKQFLEDELVSFRKDVKKDLDKHQQGVERHLTEFLAKQNILIQNLSQQIDGFQRTTQTIASDLQTVSRKISTLDEITNQQDRAIGSLQQEMKSLCERLELTITRLQGIPFIKSSFKGL